MHDCVTACGLPLETALECFLSGEYLAVMPAMLPAWSPLPCPCRACVIAGPCRYVLAPGSAPLLKTVGQDGPARLASWLALLCPPMEPTRLCLEPETATEIYTKMVLRTTKSIFPLLLFEGEAKPPPRSFFQNPNPKKKQSLFSLFGCVVT